MRRLALCLLLLSVFAAGITASPLFAAELSPQKSILVKMIAGLTSEQQADVIRRNGGTEVSTVAPLRLHVVTVPEEKLPTILDSYRNDPQTETVEEDRTRQAEAVPNDSSYGVQWSLPKIGWDSLFRLSIPLRTVKVAVLDTGVEASHPDLAGKVLAGTSIRGAGSGTTDPTGHGTWLAGIIAAVTDNSLGIAGIAWDGVQIVPVTVLNSNGSGQDSDIISGIVWAADNGADVILMGFSNSDFSQNLQDALDYAWSKGVVLVAATGNAGVTTPTFPAGGRGVMGISATDETDLLASNSNYGQSVFLAAPGTNIYTTGSKGTYTYISGTSASSAIVAGVAAYMKAVDLNATNGIIVGRLARSADGIGTVGDPNNHLMFGNGRVNMAGALADTGIEFIQPSGASPVGTGGPYIGPYTAAGCNDGSGTMTVNPETAVVGSSGNILTFVYTAECKMNNNSKIQVTIPAGWTAPQIGSSALPGYMAINSSGTSCGATLTAIAPTAPRDVIINVVCEGGQTVSFTYNGATAQTTTGDVTFPGLSKAGVNNLTPLIAPSPRVTVTKGDTATVVTSSAASVVVGTAVTFTATVAPANGSGGTPGSTVTFKDGATTLGTATLNASSQATFTTSSLAAGVHSITAAYSGDPNFYQSVSASFTQTMQQTQTIAVSQHAPASAEYGTSFVVAATATSGLPVTATPSGACTGGGTTPATVTMNAPIGTCTVTYSQGGNTLYATAPGVIETTTATKGTATVTLGSLNQTYDGTPKAVTVTTSPAGLSGVAVTYDSSATVPTNVGSYAVVASLTNANYAATNATGALVIAKGNQTISITTAAPAAAPNLGTFNVAAIASSALPVAITSSGACSGSGSGSATITMNSSSGTCSVFYNQAGNSNFNAAPQVSSSTAAQKAMATVTLGALSQTYDGTPKAVTVTTNPAGLSVTVTYAGSPTTPTAAGSYLVVATINDTTYQGSASGTLAITKTVATLALGNLSQTYDGTAKSVTVTTNPPGLSGVSVTYNGSTTAPMNAGSYAVVASLANPDYAATDASGTLIIAKATQTITVSSAAPATAQLNATFNVAATASTGLPVSIGGSGACSGTGTGSATVTMTSGSGICTVTYQQAGNTNYSPAVTTSSTTAQKAVATVTLASLSHTYNGTAKAATATTSPAGLTVTFTYDGSTSAPVNAGDYAVVGTVADASYTGSASGTLTIAKGTATLTLGNLAQTYDGTPKPVTATTSPAGLSGVSITYDGSATAPTSAGSYAVIASLTNANYTAPNATGTLVIGKGTATLTLGSLSQIYDGTPKPVTVTTSPAGLSGVSVTYDGSATVPTNVGTYAVVASLSNTNYSATNATGTLTIGKAGQTITVTTAAPVTAPYKGTFNVAATASSALPVAITSSGACSGSGSGSATIIMNSSSGTCSVFYNQAGNANFNAAAQVSSPTTAQKATATVTIGTLSQTYDGTPKAVTVTTNPAGLSVNITYAGSPNAPTAAASYAVVATVNETNYQGSASGTLTIAKAPATLTISNLSHVYDGTAKGVTVTTSPAGLSGASVTYNGSASEPTNAGSYSVVASLANANYAASDASATLTIAKAPQTITVSTAAPGTALFNATFNVAASASTGLPVAITAGGACSGTGTGTATVTMMSGTGTCTVTYQQAGTANYSPAIVTSTTSAQKASATVTLAGLTHTYNATPKAATATTAPAGLTVTFTYDGSAVAPTNAGTYAVLGTIADPNYAGSAGGTLTIDKASATLTLGGLAHTYDGTVKPAAVTTSPAGLSGVSVTYNGSATIPSNAGSYAVVASIANQNYQATDVNGTLVIVRGTATLALSNLSRTYDGTPKPATVITTPAGVNGISVTYDGSTSVPMNAGTYAVVATLTNPNYEEATTSGSLTIAKGTATMTLSGLTRAYDGSAKPVPVTTSPAGLSGVSVTYDGSATAPTNAGSYAVVAKLTNANYDAADVTGTLVINPGSQTVSFIQAPPATAAYNATFTVSAAATSGLPVAITASGVCSGTGTGTATITMTSGSGTCTVLANQGGNANYSAAAQVSGTTSARKATATVTLTNLIQPFDGDPKPASATTVPAGLTVTFTYNGSPTAPSASGTYTVVATVTDANYQGSATGTLTVGKTAQTITVTQAAPSSAAYGTTFTVAASASSSLPVAITGSGACTGSGNGSATIVMTNGSGTCTVTYNQPGSELYTPAPEVTNSTTAQKANASILLSSLAHAYDGTPKAATVSTTPAGLATSVSVSYDGSATAPTAAGSYNVVASLVSTNFQAPNVTGTLTIVKGTQTVTVTQAPPATAVFGTTFAVGATASSALPVTITASGACSGNGTGSANVTMTSGSGTCSFAFVQAGDGNYNTASATRTTAARKADATVTLTSLSHAYNGSVKTASATTTPEGLPVSITYNGSSTAPAAAGTYTVAATVNDTNYQGSATASFTIAKATATVTLGNLNHIYDGTAKAATATTNPASLTVTFTYNGSPTAPVAGGTYAVVATINDTNYQGTATGSLTIAKTAQTLTVTKAAPATAVYGSSFTVTATASSALPVAINGSGSCSGNGSNSATITMSSGTGTCTVSYDQAGNSNYTAATSATNATTASKASATVTLGSLSQSYDGTAKDATATTTPAGLPVTFTYDGAATKPLTVGNYAVVGTIASANYEGSASGTFTISKGTATLAISGLTQTYDGTARQVTVTTSPAGLTGVAITYDGSTTAPINAGSYAIAATLANPNYDAPAATASLTIAKAAQSISLSQLPPVSAAYQSTFPVTATASSSLPVTITASGACSGTGTNTATIRMEAGSGTCAVAYEQAGNGNFNPASISTATTARKAAATVNLSALSPTYDGSAKNAVVTTVPAGLPVAVTYNGSETAPVNAGSYTVAATVTDANYDGSASGILTIGKATATVTVAGATRTYDGTAKTVTVTTTPSTLTVTLTYNGSTTAPVNAGGYAVVATVEDANYAGTGSGTLTITKAPAAISLVNISQPYDGTPRPVSAVTTPAGLPVVFTYNGLPTAPTSIGHYPVVGTIQDANYQGSATGTLDVAFTTAGTALVATGQNVRVVPSSTVIMNFANITSPGQVTVTENTSPQSPLNCRAVGSGYDVTATAGYDGTISLRVIYNSGSVSAKKEQKLRLFVFNGTEWEDVTVGIDTDAKVLTGSTTVLGPIVVAEPVMQVPVMEGWWMWPGIISALGLFYRRRD